MVALEATETLIRTKPRVRTTIIVNCQVRKSKPDVLSTSASVGTSYSNFGHFVRIYITSHQSPAQVTAPRNYYCFYYWLLYTISATTN